MAADRNVVEHMDVFVVFPYFIIIKYATEDGIRFVVLHLCF